MKKDPSSIKSDPTIENIDIDAPNKIISAKKSKQYLEIL